MDLKAILKTIEQRQPKPDDKTSPKYDKLELRQTFIQRLNTLHLKSSHGKKGLIMDSETENAINVICMYINKETELEKLGYSFHKGLWLCGNFGTGKTQMILAYMQMVQNCSFVSCNDMNMNFIRVDKFTNQVQRFEGIKNFANQRDTKEKIFDDLGEEETTVMDYGNKICIMAHIISERYKGLRDGCITHVTTNLTRAQVLEVYGGRIESRMNEMFNVITIGSKIDSKDYRK
jgi:DNA replication protein DnaC